MRKPPKIPHQGAPNQASHSTPVRMRDLLSKALTLVHPVGAHVEDQATTKKLGFVGDPQRPCPRESSTPSSPRDLKADARSRIINHLVLVSQAPNIVHNTMALAKTKSFFSIIEEKDCSNVGS
jgi:hypothetical protein